jgi:threonine/homoserine/homoserine lactone efflux protein
MGYGAFLLQAVLISLSGVMAPGAVTVVVVGHGARSPRAGALVALGHGVVEFPLMVLIVLGLGPFLERPLVSGIIGVAGAAVLFWMGAGLLRSIGRGQRTSVRKESSPFVAGILMTAANPYFLVWWATVGATLVFRAWEFGIWQFAVFAVVHWSLDFGWDYFLSAASYRGVNVMGERFLRAVSLVAGILLVGFGAKFLWDGWSTLSSL